jgi:hopanoid biosynthesis associated protein HpnK
MEDNRQIRLIVNGDDFGSSHGANNAIIRAHREGILTSTSLMVNGNAADHAVRLARENKTLGVGIHVTLVCGKSTLKPSETYGLVNQHFEFSDSPMVAGFKYFFDRRLRPSLRQEIDAQFQEFRITGIPLDHLNGHCNMHMHPTIFSIVKRHTHDWGVRAIRVTDDPLLLSLRVGAGQFLYRIFHSVVFSRLAARMRPALDRRGIVHVDRVFGLLQNGRITEKYLLRLLEELRPGDYELYAHPDDQKHAEETEALCSPRVRQRIDELGIKLVRYQDLARRT